ncbi:MAG TPA: aminoacyl-tRNA hydrolase [Chitinophagales bacterium]|nr:aminoacyl-tRNA hydrolase [Chitinophagales bacterium]HMX05593.1 aminoacyl-tRNA hydrolase [Chitinophagales bacterium]HMZ89312.1 aminoacyl-tRNA hydrolase [Chitinophagales bacterium]HNA59285.1 aminoacyl-tRNA hydrolase [Chitinophagales bacterium]HNE46479.1 aminoacyl-tRNA hydrolase [Chitinophagales bacterium]
MKLLRFLFSKKQPTPSTTVEPDMKFLIACLGNIGADYDFTRHNIGFDVADHLAAKHNVSFTSGRYADVAEIRIKGRQLTVIKPTTYMNLSGKAVKYWMDKEKIAIEHLIVVTDDINLPLGTLRIRKKGSDGGHNGLKNITEILGSDQYPRLRFGAGNNFPKGAQVHFVLGKWESEEEADVRTNIERAGNAVISMVLEGIDRAMNTYN